MRSRLFFLGVTVFWLAMNFLLWRSQVAGHSAFGSALPAEAVWDKILTAPDNSTLNIYDHEVKTGVGHWNAGPGRFRPHQQQNPRRRIPARRPGAKTRRLHLEFRGQPPLQRPATMSVSKSPSPSTPTKSGRTSVSTPPCGPSPGTSTPWPPPKKSPSKSAKAAPPGTRPGPSPNCATPRPCSENWAAPSPSAFWA